MEIELVRVVPRAPRQILDEEDGHVEVELEPQASSSHVVNEERESLATARSTPVATLEQLPATPVVPPPAINPHPPLGFQAHIMYATLLWTMFLSGWNDGTTGPLLPRIQVVYHVCILHFSYSQCQC